MKDARNIFIILTVLMTLFATAGCGNTHSTGQTQEGADKDKVITIGYIPWDEDIAVTYMWKELLEEKGYKVKVAQADVAPLFAGVAQGNMDLFLDVWMPITHKSYMERFGGKFKILNTWYKRADSGLAVPDYVQAKTIEDLKNHKSAFKGKIVSIEPGTGIQELTNNAIKGYGLNGWQVIDSSTPAMLAELGRAIEHKQPIIVTLWRPHWAFKKYPIRYLEDPKSYLNPKGPEHIQTISSLQFPKDHPEVAKWLRQFKMNEEDLAALEAEMNDTKDTTKAVKKWISENRQVTDEWMK
ncbi:glycine betaine ABC transporter substrate-binding protein [Sporolactobacillus sp. THM7-7]|nr:glycine betaine ABC transporter substrate-binding protein [Sporolactobacillus sp. THM7-7]